MHKGKKIETTSSVLERYIPFVQFLGQSLGPNYEVFLYDLQKKEHPIIAIENGNLSGRKVGSLMKNVIIKMLDDAQDAEESNDQLIRHDAIARDGRQFKSSTLLIRDEQGEAVGCLCINFFIDPILKFRDLLSSLGDDLLAIPHIEKDSVIFAGEVFPNDKIASLSAIYRHVQEVCSARYGTLDERRMEDRQRIVDEFYREGGFQHKAAVSYLARKLNISEPTVYRYLSRAKKHRDE